MKIAIIGGGISGLGAAYLLSKQHEVDLYEKENRFGGHARTTTVQEGGKQFGVDTGFLVFNHPTYPLLTQLFEALDVKIEKSDMSFGFWDPKSGVAYNGQSLGGLFFQKRNLFSPSHYKMIADIFRFNKMANFHLQTDAKELELSLGAYLKSYGSAFKERYIIPMGAAIWSTPSKDMHDFPARTFLNFFKNHGLLGVSTQHQWLTVSNGSRNYVEKIVSKISGKAIINSDILHVRRTSSGVTLVHGDGSESLYDKVIFATHAPQTLALLGDDASQKEREILGAFGYKSNDAVLHNDTTALYPDKKIYAAWNYKNSENEQGVTLSYWLNRLQNLDTKKEYFVSLNEVENLTHVIERIAYEHPQFDAKAIAMQARRHEINGINNTFFAGAYWRYGFHEDGLWSANTIAQSMGCGL